MCRSEHRCRNRIITTEAYEHYTSRHRIVIIRHGDLRHRIVRHGVIRHHTSRHHGDRHHRVYRTVRHHAIRHHIVRHHAVRHYAVRHHAVRHHIVRHHRVRPQVVSGITVLGTKLCGSNPVVPTLLRASDTAPEFRSGLALGLGGDILSFGYACTEVSNALKNARNETLHSQ